MSESGDDGRLAYRVRGARVECRIDVPDLVPAARCLYPGHRVEPGEGPVDVHLFRASEGEYRTRVPGGVWIDESLPDAMVHFELSVTDVLAERVEGVAVVHGGAVEVGGGALVVSGPGDSGKSSLTAAMAGLGRPVFGDDVLLLDRRTAELLPFPRLLRIREPARTLLDVPPSPPPLAELWPGSSFVSPDALGSRWAGPSPVAVVVFPRRSAHEDEPRLEPVPGGESMRRMVSELLMVEGASPGDFDLLARTLDGAELHELRFGRTDRAARALLDRFVPEAGTGG